MKRFLSILLALAGCHHAAADPYGTTPAATTLLTCEGFVLGDALTEALRSAARTRGLSYDESKGNDTGTRAYISIRSPRELVTMAFGIGDLGAVVVQDYAGPGAAQAGALHRALLPLFAGCRPRSLS